MRSAFELFVEQGYPATTIAAVARRAHVVPDTIYKAFGSKPGLLKATLDVVVGGDDDNVALLDRAGPRAMRDEPDQRRQLALFAAGITEQLERVRPLDDILRSAAVVDTEAARLRGDVQLRQRRQAMRTVVDWLGAHGPLRTGLSNEDAAAIVWTLTSPEVHHMLRDTWAWTARQYETWLHDTLVASLLPPA